MAMMAERTAVKSRRRADAVVVQIATDIITGQYPEGSVLPTEQDFGERFDVSRTVVREAVARLARCGLIKVRHGLGSVVLERARWHALDPDILAAIMVTQRQSLGDPEAYNAADIAFHDALIGASGNHLLREVIGPISQVWRIGSVVTMRRDPEVVTYSMQGHEEIFAAMVAGDPATAREAMNRHLDRFEQRLANVLLTSTMPRSLEESEQQDRIVTLVGE